MKKAKKPLCIVISFLMILHVVLLNVTALTLETGQISLVSLSDIPDVISVEEVRSKGYVERMRSEESMNSVVYRDADGTRTAYYFSMPIKYIDENGDIIDKSNRLSPISSKSGYSIDKYSFANTSNNSKIFFPKILKSATPISIEYGGIKLEMSPLSVENTVSISSNAGNVSRVCANEAAVTKLTDTSSTGLTTDYATYHNVFGENTSIRYTPMYNGIKEDIILNQNIGKNSFIFQINLSGLIPQENGLGYSLVDPQIGEPIAYINPIVVNDSAGNISVGKNIMQLTHIRESLYQLTVTVDQDFLNDENTVYPVYIDPSITTPSNVIRDETIYNSSNNFSTDPYFVLGNNALFTETSMSTTRGLVKFNGLVSDYKYNWEDVTISKIEYFVRDIWSVGGAVVNIHHLTSPTPFNLEGVNGGTFWNAYNTSVIDSKTIGTDGTSRNGTGTGDWYGFDISNAFLNWQSGSYGGLLNHYGLMLKSSNESTSCVVFAASEYGTADYMPFLRMSFSVSGMETEGIISGTTYRFTSATSGLTMVTSTLTDNSPATQGTFTNGTNYADFKIVYRGSGEYSILSADAPTKALSVGNAINDSFGSRLVGLYYDYGAAVQRWYIVLGDVSNETEDGSDIETYYFVNKAYPDLVLCNNGSSSYGAQLYVSQSGNGIYWNLTLSQNFLDIQLHTQELDHTCGAACAKMVIDYFENSNVEEWDVFYYSKKCELSNGVLPTKESLSHAATVGQYTKAINHFTTNDHLYTWKHASNYSISQYKDFIIKNLVSGYPIQIVIRVELNQAETFGYNRDVGHYILITGIYDDSNGTTMIQYHDPYNHFASGESGIRCLPLATIYQVNQAHGYIISAL